MGEVFVGVDLGARLIELLLKPVQNFFDEYIWSLKKEEVQICFATLGADAGIIATAALAQRTVKG